MGHFYSALDFKCIEKGNVKMLRNTQIKIILTLLILGIVIIGSLGYINYKNTEVVLEQVIVNREETIPILQEYQKNAKMLTLGSMLIFTLICALVRCICYRKNNYSNYKNHSRCKESSSRRRNRNKGIKRCKKSK